MDDNEMQSNDGDIISEEQEEKLPSLPEEDPASKSGSFFGEKSRAPGRADNIKE